jgi:hypothetical protein
VAGPSLALRWNDPDNTGSVSAPINVGYDQDENFEIKGVTPGPYLLITTGADDGKTLTARTPISVGDEDIADLEIVIGPENQWQGTIRMEGDEPTAPTGLLVMLEPRRPTAFPSRSQVGRSGEFSAAVSPNETYDLYVLNAPDDAYLKSIQVGNSDRLASGLEAGPGDAPSKLEVVLSTRGGQVSGQAVTADPSIVATGATIMLLPDPPEGHVQAYKTAYADEYGNFLMRGVAPGDYVVVAWMDQAPCQIYNPDDLTACRAAGVRLTIAEAGGESVQVTAN